jgi:hypothetical protein
LGGGDDVVFSDKDGVFMEATPLKINLMALSAKIMRHSIPDYQTLLVSTLRCTASLTGIANK